MFAKIGIHKSWLEDSLFKISDNSLRPIADVKDIVQRFFKLYSTLLTQAENDDDTLNKKKSQREIVAYTIARAISGLANVQEHERDALPEQARAIITDQSSTTKIASAMDELASIKNLQQRLQLVEALKTSTLTDAQRLFFIEAVSEIPGDVNYATVITLLPTACKQLDCDASQDYILYRVTRGLALNASPEKLDALVTIAKLFVSKNKQDQDNNENHSPSHLISAFEALGITHPDLRDNFIKITEVAAETLKVTNLYNLSNILRTATAHDNIETAQAFFERLAPTMEKNPKLILEVFQKSYIDDKPSDREQIINLVNRLDALPNAEADSEDNTLPAFDLFRSTSTLGYRSAEEREHLVSAVEKISISENLNKIQRNTLLTMIGRVAYSKVDIETAAQALQNFSWAGNPKPSFKENLSFVSSFFSGFSYLPFSEKGSKIFGEMLDSAAKYLTPELVKKHSNCYQDLSLLEFDYEAPVTLMDAIFRSSAYDDLDGTLKCAISQLSKLNDANIEITDAEKASLILTVAAINPADRKDKMETTTKKTEEEMKQYYFSQFMEQLTTHQ